MEQQYLGVCDYQTVYQQMLDYTVTRGLDDVDKVWLLQHEPIFTQGTSCKDTPFLPVDIPVVKTDRGGQITYHGPGQLIAYFMLDLRRLGIGPKALVARIEQLLIDFLKCYDIDSDRKVGAPGVYVSNKKIAALGLRIKSGCCYHGLSLNVDMDITPFQAIHPCGYEGLEVAQMRDFKPQIDFESVRIAFNQHLTCYFY